MAVSMVPVEPELELAKPLSRIVFRVMYLVAGIFRLVQSYVKISGGKKQYIYIIIGVNVCTLWEKGQTLSSAEVSSWPPGCWAGLLFVGSGRGVVLSEEFLLCDEPSE